MVRGIGGAPAARPSEPVVGVSSGRVLEFRADKIGQGFVLNVGARPKQPYVLGVRPLLSPAGAIMQAFVADKPLGPQFDLYASPRRLGPSVLPLGPVPAGTSEIEICVVGRNDRSQGLAVELDYVRWEPDLLGPGTASGVWMHALGTHACDYGPQDLGPAFSGGHQFWVRPSQLNAWVDIALEVPTAGPRELSVKYTKSWDYACLQAFLDGQPLGPITDTYAPTVVSAEPLTLGKPELTAGRHVLRFQAVGAQSGIEGLPDGHRPHHREVVEHTPTRIEAAAECPVLLAIHQFVATILISSWGRPYCRTLHSAVRKSLTATSRIRSIEDTVTAYSLSAVPGRSGRLTTAVTRRRPRTVDFGTHPIRCSGTLLSGSSHAGFRLKKSRIPATIRFTSLSEQFP